MSIRDFIRFVVLVTTMTLIDCALFALLGLPKDSANEILVMAAFMVTIWAIREGQQ